MNTTKNNAPVDVLARVEAVWGKDSPEYRAVAGLIDAATEARKIIGMAVIGNTLRANYRDSRAKPALHALDDALARVQP